MTLNYNSNRNAIQEAYNRVTESQDGDKWVIYDYEGNSNTIKVGEEGEGGLDDFSASFSSGRLQFGVIAVRLSSDVIPKIVLIHWQGEGVATLRLASTTSHAEEFRRFLKTVHIVLHARSEIDVEPESIKKEVRKLPAANTSAHVESSYSTPEKVQSVYKPVKPHAELSSSARDQFWSKMNDEENQRVAEEKASREAIKKEHEAERKRMAAQIHSQAEEYEPGKVNSVYKPVKPHVEVKPSEREQFWNKMNEEEKRRMAEEKAYREEQQRKYEEDQKRMASQIQTQVENFQRDAVSSVYKPVKPHVEISSSAREEFWNKMNEEEKRRVEEEKAANEEKQKRFEQDRKRITEDIHSKLQLNENSNNNITKPDAKSISANSSVVSGGLVGSRKEVFNTIATESSPVVKPIVSSGVKKWPPVDTNQKERMEIEKNDHPISVDSIPDPQPEVANTIQNYVPEVMKPPQPVADVSNYEEPPSEPKWVEPPPQEPVFGGSQYDVVPEMPDEPVPSISQIPTHISSQYDMPPVMEDPVPATSAPKIDQYDFPPSLELRALALWDYQAADDTEISFDPDDIITEIDQVDSGWWKGKAPNGRVGLFPANYVKLI